MSVDYDPVAAGDGQWVRDPKRFGVLIWQAAPAPQRAHLSLDYGPVVCRCGARATETCRTENGNRTKNHTYRSAPRVCPCGAEVKWKGRLCRECRVALDTDRKRAWRANNEERVA